MIDIHADARHRSEDDPDRSRRAAVRGLRISGAPEVTQFVRDRMERAATPRRPIDGLTSASGSNWHDAKA